VKKIYENNSPGVKFLNRGKQLMRLHGRVIQQMLADHEAEGAQLAATEISERTDMQAFLRDTMAKVASSQARLADIDLMFQLFFCRHVDNFQIFLEEVLHDVIRRDPTLIAGLKLRKADAAIPADEQLERRLRKLSFMSLQELRDTLAAEMGFSLIPDPVEYERAAFLYDVRNLITHNYGIVDRHFLRKHPSQGVTEGAHFPITPEFIKSGFEDLMRVSHDIQAAAEKKFGALYRTTIREVPDWHPTDT